MADINDSPLLSSSSMEDLLDVLVELLADITDTRPLSRVWSQDWVLSRLSVSMFPLSPNSLSHSMLTCWPYTLLTPPTLTGLPNAWTGESHSWNDYS